MPKYTAHQRQHATTLYTEVGTAEASRQTGIPPTSIKRWVRDAGVTDQANTKKTVAARAAGAEKVLQAWGDFREEEASSAGRAAGELRGKSLDAEKSRDAKDWAIAYGIFIDKAELLSGRATSRIETWAESEVDAELRRVVKEFEDASREG